MSYYGELTGEGQEFKSQQEAPPFRENPDRAIYVQGEINDKIIDGFRSMIEEAILSAPKILLPA